MKAAHAREEEARRQREAEEDSLYANAKPTRYVVDTDRPWTTQLVSEQGAVGPVAALKHGVRNTCVGLGGVRSMNRKGYFLCLGSLVSRRWVRRSVAGLAPNGVTSCQGVLGVSECTSGLW